MPDELVKTVFVLFYDINLLNLFMAKSGCWLRDMEDSNKPFTRADRLGFSGWI